MWAKVDPQTGAIIGDPKDVRTPNLPQNIVDNKIIVTDFVKDATKNWETVQIFKDLGGGAYEDFTSVKNHKDANGKSIYNEMAAKVAVAATSSPRATLSILADNGVIDPIYYWNEDEKKAAIAQRYAEIEEVNRVANNPLEPTEQQKKDIEISLVKKGIDLDGTYNPQLTDAQVKLAQDHVLKVVDIQMKETMDARGRTQYAPQRNDNNPISAKNDYTLYNDLATAFISGDNATLNSLFKDQSYKTVYVKDKGVKVVQMVDDGQGGTKEVLIHAPTKELSDLTVYFFGRGASQVREAEKQRRLWTEAQGGGTPKQTEVPTASKADWKAAGWSDAQIAQGVKEGKIKLN
jgi:hypothetical protein